MRRFVAFVVGVALLAVAIHQGGFFGQLTAAVAIPLLPFALGEQ